MSEQVPLPSKMRELVYDEAGHENYRQWRVSTGAAISPIMGDETVFDKQRAAFVRPRSCRALQECLSSIRDPEIISDIEAGKCGWDTVTQARDIVLDTLEEAKNTYNTRESNNSIRRLARQGGTLFGTVEPLLDMIPDQDGLSVLRGGLATIFKILQRREANREKIFGAFENIPILFVRAQEAHQSFSTESNIQLEVLKLYETLLEEVPKLIDLLLHRHRQKSEIFMRDVPALKPVELHSNLISLEVPTRLFKYLPEQESKDIDGSIECVTSASRSLDLCIESVNRKTWSATCRSSAETLRQTQAVRQTVHTTNFRLGHIEEQNNDVKMQLDSVEQSVIGNARELIGELKEVKEIIRAKQNSLMDSAPPEMVSTIQTFVYYVVLEGEYARDVMGSPPSQSLSPFPHRPFRVTIEQLFEALDVPHLGPTDDLQRVVTQSKIMEVEALGRARWLMVEDGFKAWLAPKQNDFLLVDGHCAGLGNRRTSPLSVFCASLAIAMAHTSTFVSLAYFCGEHFSDFDPLSGPPGVLRSLIVQLFQYPDIPEPNLDFIDEEFFWQISQHNVQALSDLFRLLVEQIGKDVTLYCIIDNISELEGTTHGWNEALRCLVEGLIGITEDERIQATFKLLVTCKNKSTEVIHLIPQKHIALRAYNVHRRPMMLSTFSDDVRSVMSSELAVNQAYEDVPQGSEGEQEVTRAL